MKNGKKKTKDGRPTRAPTAEGAPAPSDPFDDFMTDFHRDPDKPLRFLRAFLDGEDAYSPAVDVVEERDKITILADLPGVAEADLKVEFVAGGLVLRGRRMPAPEPTGSRLRRAERPAGEFSKQVPLPAGLDTEGAVAKMEKGVLTLTIRRAVDAHSKRLKSGTS